MFPQLPPELNHLDEEFKTNLQHQLQLLYQDKVKNGLFVKRMLLHTNQEGYVKTVQFIGNMWRNKSALAHKSFEIEGEAIIAIIKIISAANFIGTSLDCLLQANGYIHQLELLYGDNPYNKRLIENAYGGIERAQLEAMNRFLRLLEEA